MKDFAGKLAVVTGGGSGMGQALVRRLSAAGCDVAFCDVSAKGMEQTKAGCDQKVRITTHVCDVSDESQVLRFRNEALEQHQTDRINLLFNNAGIGGGGSVVVDEREEWERTFGVCWFGVYYCTRAFLEALIAADEAHLVNTSSVNGFWASLGPGIAHTAYSAAKFAVKGFSEALITDFRLNAPHVKVSVVMPGHIGTSIAFNTARVLGRPEAMEMTTKDLDVVRDRFGKRGIPLDEVPDDQLREIILQMQIGFRDNAPVTADQAATIILDGVREDRWRILVGEDAQAIDRLVREFPEEAYEQSFVEKLSRLGHFAGISAVAAPSSQE
jgi:NAD(P)-dependent dehydrogenase (short-subunit alcohol dehydrogenase family)